LSKKYNVTIFDKSNEILSGASKKNQLRFHKGYHYPRSKKTLNEIRILSSLFINFFGKDVLGSTINYYGVAKENSKITYDKFLKFLKINKLSYKKYSGKYFNLKNVSGTLISEETNLNYFKIKKKINTFLKKTSIKLRLNTRFKKSLISKYDKIIIACYDQNNNLLNQLGIKPKQKYRFELIEKIIISLPIKFYNKSFMVFGLPLVARNLTELKILINDVKYKIYNIYLQCFNDINSVTVIPYSNLDVNIIKYEKKQFI
jgi:D-amino-acid oxidase